MADDWLDVRLGDVTEVITKGTTPTTLGYRFASAGINFVKSESVTFDGSIDRSKFAFIDEQTHGALKRSQLREGDILFSMAGMFIGKTAVVPKEILPANTNQAVGIVRLNQDRVVPRFIDYHLRNPAYNRFLNNLVAQSAQPNLNLAEIGNLPIKLPPLAEQRAIAHILGALDDKIELNRRMNETLEAMAHALFKSWFVDFDPIYAKAEGHAAGLARGIAELFPDKLEDSNGLEVPTGWLSLGLDEIARFLNGLALQKYPPVGDRSLPAIKIAELRAGQTSGADRASADLPTDYVVEDGDVLFSWSGSLECVLWAGGRGALNQHLFKVTSDRYPKWLYYLAIHQHLPGFRHIAEGKATTMGHIQRHHLSEAKVAVPPPATLTALSAHFEPLIETVWRRRLESRTLAGLRDTLLPKLISGELRVKQAEKLIEEAV